MERQRLAVLLIEDSPVDAEIVRRSLNVDGPIRFDVDHASDLEEGLEKLERNDYDILLLDLSLPDSFGTDTLTNAQNAAPDLPIVVMTGLEDEELGAQLVQMGAQDYLVKCQDSRNLLSRSIRHAVERHRIEKELRVAQVRALDAARAKSEFLSGMSHEIRTPLNSILGMADLLSETDLTDEQRRCVSVFRSAGEALLEVINGILDLSKAEAGALDLYAEPFEPTAMIESTLDIVAFNAHKKGLALALDVHPDVPERLTGDPGRLRQILINLLGNAVKFTDRGEIVVRVAPEKVTEEKILLRFSVSDTGIGVPRERQGLIFERFAQADGSVTRRYGGTGLGLSLAMELSHLMGGRIWVESEEGIGSTFHFTAAFDPEQAECTRTPAPPYRNAGRVLVAMSNAAEAEILSSWLERTGYGVTRVAGGEEAVAAVGTARSEEQPFDLLFVDCRAPGIGGFEVVARLLDAGPARVIMMLTADHRPGDIKRCEEIGIAGWLVKPLKPSQVDDVVRGVREGRQRALEAPETGESSGRSLEILLADDSPDNRSLIHAYLKRTPHRITDAENGAIALDLFKKSGFDLVLMDMQMPEMDGYSATKAIRGYERHRSCEPTPVVALTAYAFPEERQKSFDAGCDLHLTKPLRKQELIDTLERFSGGGRIVVEVDDDISDLVEGFLENRVQDVEKLRSAVASRDFDTVRVLGHNMKGVGRNYGFEAITEIGAVLESAASNLRREEIVKNIDRLEDYLDRVEVA